jgi:predicted enzyme related to lactoylglutathione lyase
MSRVLGIGGIFFKARDPEALRAWYRKHLGLEIEAWGGLSLPPPAQPVPTIWSIFDSANTYFDPSPAPFMINYRVADLPSLLLLLRSEGCAVDEKTEDSEFGSFAWVMDPEGNRIELWQAPA